MVEVAVVALSIFWRRMRGMRRVILGIGIFSVFVALSLASWAAADSRVLPTVHTLVPCFLMPEVTGRTLCYEDRVPMLLAQYDVESIFSAIRVGQAYDPAIADCHFLAHRLGEAMAATDPARWAEFIAIGESETLCSYGYVHGVSIGVFKNDPMTPEEIEARLQSFKDACAQEAFRGVRKSNCFHALGHMFYYLTGTDINAALRICDRVHPIGSPEAPRCYAGVTMNLFMPLSKDGEVDPLHLTVDTAPAFCEALGEDRYVGACKRASWILQVDSFVSGAGIDSFCHDQPNDEEVELCFHKVFHGLAWKLINEDEQMQRVCDVMQPQRQEKCYTEAALEFLITKGGSRAVGDAASFCSRAQSTAVVAGCLDELARWGKYLYDTLPRERTKYCATFDHKREILCADGGI